MDDYDFAIGKLDGFRIGGGMTYRNRNTNPPFTDGRSLQHAGCGRGAWARSLTGAGHLGQSRPLTLIVRQAKIRLNLIGD
jgi:hypothetical protein